MQFDSTWDSEFNRIVQGMNTCDNNLYHSQLANETKIKSRGLAIRRQECKFKNTDELLASLENYSPASDLIDIKQFLALPNLTIRRYKESVYNGQFINGKR